MARFTERGDTPHPRTHWDIFDASYREDFERLKDNFYHETMMMLRDIHHPVVVDLAAPTMALVQLQREAAPTGPFTAFSMGLHDPRLSPDIEAEKALGIRHIHADLRNPESLTVLKEALESLYVDLIMARPYGGYTYLPTTCEYYKKMLQKSWNLLHPDHGTLMFQTAPFDVLARFGINPMKFLTALSQNNTKVCYVSKYTGDQRDGDSPYGLIGIRRSAQSPATLPFD